MAVAGWRSAVTLWFAWIGAAGIGAAGMLMLRPEADSLDSGVAIVLSTAPLVLLQYLVLRAIAGLPPVAGALWIGASLLASVAYLFAGMLWAQVINRTTPRS
jgi:hypothetical protein